MYRQVVLADTCIDEKPPSQARNGGKAKVLKQSGGGAGSATAQPAPPPESNMYKLAYHVLDRNNEPVASYAQATPIKLCNSYHTVSADEKMFRQMYNKGQDNAKSNAMPSLKYDL